MIPNAHAMAAPGGADGGSAGLLGFLPLILIFVIFYFLLIRPQQKKSKDHQALLKDLKKGDRVMTNGGLLGEIKGFRNEILILKVDENVKIEVHRQYISQVLESK